MKYNLEKEIEASEFIMGKILADNAYAQNIYAAMCNVQWQKREVLPILSDDLWTCSWRYAGGMVARFRGQGDYMDYYCSGIRSDDTIEDERFIEMTKEDQELYLEAKRYASEGEVTKEVEEDLLSIGWQPVYYDPEDLI